MAESVAEAIRELRRQFVTAVRRGDPQAASAVYADDARVLLPSAARLDGRPAIEAFLRTGLDAGLISFELDPVDLVAERVFACEVGRYRLRIDALHEPTTTVQGRYLSVARVGADGAWRRAVDVFEPDSP